MLRVSGAARPPVGGPGPPAGLEAVGDTGEWGGGETSEGGRGGVGDTGEWGGVNLRYSAPLEMPFVMISLFVGIKKIQFQAKNHGL